MNAQQGNKSVFGWFGKKKGNNQGRKTAAAQGNKATTEFHLPPSGNENQTEERCAD